MNKNDDNDATNTETSSFCVELSNESESDLHDVYKDDYMNSDDDF